jgi:hypothetical protein
MITGVETLGPLLAEAGMDVLYFVDPPDPVQKGFTMEKIHDLLPGSTTGRFILLHPVDAVFPDTPWESTERLIDAWRKWRLAKY